MKNQRQEKKVKLAVLSLDGKFIGCKGDVRWEIMKNPVDQGAYNVNEADESGVHAISLLNLYKVFNRDETSLNSWIRDNPNGCIVSAIEDIPNGDEVFRYSVFKNKQGYVIGREAL